MGRWMNARRGDEGFTLVELLIVIAIIGVLAAVAIPVFLSQTDKAENAAVESDLNSAYKMVLSAATVDPDVLPLAPIEADTVTAIGDMGSLKPGHDLFFYGSTVTDLCVGSYTPGFDLFSGKKSGVTDVYCGGGALTDSDNDGVSDLDELLASSDPLNDQVTAGAPTDTDGDGFSDAAEGYFGTNPTDNADYPADATPGGSYAPPVDSDGDGYSDAEEVAAGSDPNDPTSTPLTVDSDGDGYSDAEEVAAGSDPNDPTSTPLTVDSDGDGYSDAEETLAGSNPNDPNSVPPPTLSYTSTTFTTGSNSEVLSPTVTNITGTPTYSITEGTLPPGVTFDPATGTFTGPGGTQWQAFTTALQAGGAGGDIGMGIAVDASGNFYIGGRYSGTATFGATTLTSVGSTDVFVAKLDPSGNWLWAASGGGTGQEYTEGIAVDSSGNSYVTGRFPGSVTFGATTLTSVGSEDVYIAKLDSSGNWLWAKRAGGTGGDYGYGVTVDSSGSPYITGYFSNTATFGTTNLTSAGQADLFVAKLDSSGNWLWATRGGGTNAERGHSIAVDSSGNSYVVGIFSGFAFFTSPLSSSGGTDLLIAKLGPTGNFLWVKKAGGTGEDYGYDVAVDSSGNPYITGYFSNTATFGTTNLTSAGSTDVFVAKLDPSGNFSWATRGGGTGGDYGYGVAVDSSGNPHITGYFPGTATFGTTNLTSAGSTDVFVAKLDPSGNFSWATRGGGTGGDYGYDIAVDSSGNPFSTGVFTGTATFGATNLTSAGSNDVFVGKVTGPTIPGLPATLTVTVTDDNGSAAANLTLSAQ